MQTGITEISSNKFLGKLCSKGHDWNGTGKSLRLKSSGKCIQCTKEYAQANRERLSRNRLARYHRNHDKETERQRKYMAQKRKEPGFNEKQKAYKERKRREAGVPTREEMYTGSGSI